jgi:hypothetical protein
MTPDKSYNVGVTLSGRTYCLRGTFLGLRLELYDPACQREELGFLPEEIREW